MAESMETETRNSSLFLLMLVNKKVTSLALSVWSKDTEELECLITDVVAKKCPRLRTLVYNQKWQELLGHSFHFTRLQTLDVQQLEFNDSMLGHLAHSLPQLMYVFI